MNGGTLQNNSRGPYGIPNGSVPQNEPLRKTETKLLKKRFISARVLRRTETMLGAPSPIRTKHPIRHPIDMIYETAKSVAVPPTLPLEQLN